MMRDVIHDGKPLKDLDTMVREHALPVMPKGTQPRCLYVYKNQVMYDVDAQINILTTNRKDKDGSTDDSATDMLDRYKSLFDRWIDRAVDKVKEQLIIAVIEHRNYAYGDELHDWAEKEIHLAMPSWWDDTAWKPMVSAVHEYIVDYVLTEFLKIYLTPSDPLTIAKDGDADDAYMKIKNCLCKHKAGTIKKPLRPLGF